MFPGTRLGRRKPSTRLYEAASTKYEQTVMWLMIRRSARGCVMCVMWLMCGMSRQQSENPRPGKNSKARSQCSRWLTVDSKALVCILGCYCKRDGKIDYKMGSGIRTSWCVANGLYQRLPHFKLANASQVTSD
jgi:hypothetical protein